MERGDCLNNPHLSPVENVELALLECAHKAKIMANYDVAGQFDAI